MTSEADIMPARSTAYVPVIGDHWLQTEWSTIRHKRPAVHGTKQEAVKSLHDRVKFLRSRGWRLVSQKMLDDITPGERRMMVRIEPPAEYAHCGDSVIEYKSCGGISFCPECRAEDARQHAVYAPAEAEASAPRFEQLTCIADFERGICRSCGQPLRRHLTSWAQSALATFWG